MSDHPAAKARGGILTWTLWGAALLGVAAVVYIIAQSSTNPSPKAPAAAPPAGGIAAKLSHAGDGAPPPDYVIYDGEDRALKLAGFKGQVVVMNLWATWCAPCKVEMPTLARLQAAYDGRPVKVVAVSIDKAEARGAAKALIAANAPLAFYNDPEAKLPWVLKPEAAGVPTTVIYGKDGLERVRVGGEADWAGAEARALIDKVLAE